MEGQGGLEVEVEVEAQVETEVEVKSRRAARAGAHVHPLSTGAVALARPGGSAGGVDRSAGWRFGTMERICVQRTPSLYCIILTFCC